MSENLASPTPWRAEEWHNKGWRVMDANDYPLVTDLEEEEAHVIASAPELLEAAHQIWERREDIFGLYVDPYGPAGQAFLTLKKSIDKAEGASNGIRKGGF